MAEYIDREYFCKNICLCDEKKCNKEKCSIYTAPTADVAEVKHGEWKKQKPDTKAMKQFHDLGFAKGMGENSIFWICSCCNGWGTPIHKYCSNCGAKMDRKENDHE